MFLTCKNLCFCAGDAIVAKNLRYRKFPAISTQPKTTKPKTRVGGDSPAAPIPAMPQPEPLSKAKKRMFSYVLKLQNQTPRPKAQGHPKTRKSKTRVGGDSHSPTPTHVTALPVFCGKKRVFSHAVEFRNQNPRSQAQGPDSRAQARA